MALETCQAAGMTHNHIRLKALHEVINLIRRVDACRGRRPEIFCPWINWVWIKFCLQHSITFNQEKSQGVDPIPIDLSNKLLTLNPPWRPPDSSICRSCAVLNALTQLAPSPSAMASCISWAPSHPTIDQDSYGVYRSLFFIVVVVVVIILIIIIIIIIIIPS